MFLLLLTITELLLVFKYLTMPAFVLQYETVIRSYLDYCSSVWPPYRKGGIEALEEVQKRATKILPALKHFVYKDCLKSKKVVRLQLYITDTLDAT